MCALLSNLGSRIKSLPCWDLALRCVLAAGCNVLSSVTLLAAHSENHLESYLLEKAEEIVGQAEKNDVKVIGVLKYRVMELDAPPNVLNVTMQQYIADILESQLRLVVKKENSPLQIVYDASAIASQIKGANHLEPKGRECLFKVPGIEGKRRYPVSRGGESKPVDWFITGLAVVESDFETMRISVQKFEEESNKLNPVGDLSPQITLPISLRAPLGVPAGAGLALKSVGLQENLSGETEHDEKEKSGISFDVLYDGVKVHPFGTTEKGVLQLYEPQEGQEVTFKLKHNVRELGRIAAVVKVNGENTLYQETLPSTRCRKWVLNPGKTLEIKGFQIMADKYLPFEVLSDEESLVKNRINYSSQNGLITVELFREKTEAQSTPKNEKLDDAPFESASEDLYVYIEQQSKYRQAKKQESLAMKGLISSSGNVEVHATTRIAFHHEPEPFQVAVLRYYKSSQNP